MEIELHSLYSLGRIRAAFWIWTSLGSGDDGGSSTVTKIFINNTNKSININKNLN